MDKAVVHNVRIPCNCLPLVGEADYGRALRTMIHCDRTAPFHVMIYLLKGGMEIVEDGVCHKLTPGTLFFLKSGVHHWGEKPFLNGSAWYYVHFLQRSPLRTQRRTVRSCTRSREWYCREGKTRAVLFCPKC